MKYIILLILLFTFKLEAQTVKIKHIRYTSTFDTVKHYPVTVKYWVTRKDVDCNKKEVRYHFKKDPLFQKQTDLADSYKYSGYDRGHNAPANYFKCNATLSKDTYYYDNVTPQTPRLNRGTWKTVESLVADLATKYDSIYVTTGALGNIGKIGKVTIPKYCWKVIYIKKYKSYQYYLFDNSVNFCPISKTGRRTTAIYLDKLTGLNVKKL